MDRFNSKPSRILICGGRAFNDYELFSAIMEKSRVHFAPAFCIIQGGARGADLMGKHWAAKNGVPCLQVDALWDRYSKRAGHIRNKWMLDWCKPDLVIAFPGGAGTDSMVALATNAGITVYAIR